MTKWEQRIWTHAALPGDTDLNWNRVNSYLTMSGNEGWELVNIWMRNRGREIVIAMKRPGDRR